MEFQSYLSDEFEAGVTYKPDKADWLDGRWSGIRRKTVFTIEVIPP